MCVQRRPGTRLADDNEFIRLMTFITQFTARDFTNLARIGQASKIERLATTGRFGLGFNSAYHFTDLPQLVSGSDLVMFDPHASYVPGATTAQVCGPL